MLSTVMPYMGYGCSFVFLGMRGEFEENIRPAATLVSCSLHFDKVVREGPTSVANVKFDLLKPFERWSPTEIIQF